MNNNKFPEDFKRVNFIVLNGLIADCKTHDGCYETIGVVSETPIKTLDGGYTWVIKEFPFSKNMEEEIGWGKKFASVQMLTGKTPIDMDHIEDTKIVSMMGEVEHEYYHEYSDYTGYLWTNEKFKCGGHDLIEILNSHRGEYIHLEIELFERIIK